MSVVAFPRSRVVGLTSLLPVHLKALRFIQSYISKHGQWPSFDQIQDAADTRSKRGTVRVVNRLFQAGAIERPATPSNQEEQP